MSLKFTLPLGEPNPAMTATESEQFRYQLPHDGTPFSADHVAGVYQASTTTLASGLEAVTAMYAGMAFYRPDRDMIILVMTYTDHRRLQDAVGKYIPAPIRLIIRPVIPRFEGVSTAVDQGQVIADLDSNECHITLQDQRGFYVSPIHWFQLLNNFGFWDIPVTVRCPLIPSTDTSDPIGIAGDAVTAGSPYFSIQGGSLPFVVHNPPPRIPNNLLSFVSSDTLQIALHNSGNGNLRITDQSHEMYRTSVSPPLVEPAGTSSWQFIPQNQLKPSHETYTQKVYGKRTQGKPLSYHLRVQVASGGPTLTTTIEQDMRDIIRQEYLFHNKPFQTFDNYIDVPSRHQVERNRKPGFARFFTPAEVQKSNYRTADNNWMLNVNEVYKVAEYMRWTNAQRLITKRLAGNLSDHITSFGLKINSSWRNPERNEKVDGVRNSNHQFGRALDLVAGQINKSTTYSNERKTLQVELFEAGRDFLQKLIDMNDVDKCTKVEILLEKNSALLWSYKAKADGTIESIKGGSYASVVGSQPSAEETAIRKAAGKASHVHIGWKPNGISTLQLPDIPPYDYGNLTQVPTEFRNLILIAKEHNSVEATNQLPLNHVAESIRNHLDTLEPNIATEIREVDDPIEFLAYLNAFRKPQYNINYFFSLSHAWNGGLTLLNFDSDEIPYQNRDDDGNIIGPEIHDPEVFRDTNWFAHDPSMAEDTGFDFTEEANVLEVGSNDTTQIKTNQIRIANLQFLLSESKSYLKRTFAQAKGIYVLGCKAAGEEDDPASSFCETLATILNHSVYGASYYSKVFQYDSGDWQEKDLSRSDPAPPADQPVLLIPGSLGGRQLVKHLLTEHKVPEVTLPPQSPDLLKVIESVLRRCDPQEAE